MCLSWVLSMLTIITSSLVLLSFRLRQTERECKSERVRLSPPLEPIPITTESFQLPLCQYTCLRAFTSGERALRQMKTVTLPTYQSHHPPSTSHPPLIFLVLSPCSCTLHTLLKWNTALGGCLGWPSSSFSLFGSINLSFFRRFFKKYNIRLTREKYYPVLYFVHLLKETHHGNCPYLEDLIFCPPPSLEFSGTATSAIYR